MKPTPSDNMMYGTIGMHTHEKTSGLSGSNSGSRTHFRLFEQIVLRNQRALEES